MAVKYATVFIILLIIPLLSSCSTLTNESTVTMNIYPYDTDSVRIYLNNDSSNWHTLPASVDVMRSKNNLIITAQKDTVQKKIEVESSNCARFWWGNLFSGVGVIGYAIDLTNSKRFTYPETIFIKFNEDEDKAYSEAEYFTWLLPQPQKNLFNLKYSIPEGNHFYLNKGDNYGTALGFLGISFGFEYYLTDKYCLNMDVGAITDFMFPFPAPVDYDGSYNRSFAIYFDAQIETDYKHLHYGMGIQVTGTSYIERETVDLFPVYIDTLKHFKTQSNFGFAFSTHYRVSKNFALGLNYYPSFLVLDEKPELKFHYSHLLFFDLIFKFEAYRPKNKKIIFNKTKH